MMQYGMDAARLMEKVTRRFAALLPHSLRRSTALSIALRIHASTPGSVDWPMLASRFFWACRTVLILSETRSPELFTIRVTCPMPKVNSQIRSPRKRNSSRSTGISDAGLRFIFSFFCRKRITGCRAAATGIATIKGDSLSQISGSTQRSTAKMSSSASSLSTSRSAAFLSSVMCFTPFHRH